MEPQIQFDAYVQALVGTAATAEPPTGQQNNTEFSSQLASIRAASIRVKKPC